MYSLIDPYASRLTFLSISARSRLGWWWCFEPRSESIGVNNYCQNLAGYGGFPGVSAKTKTPNQRGLLK